MGWGQAKRAIGRDKALLNGAEFLEAFWGNIREITRWIFANIVAGLQLLVCFTHTQDRTRPTDISCTWLNTDLLSRYALLAHMKALPRLLLSAMPSLSDARERFNASITVILDTEEGMSCYNTQTSFTLVHATSDVLSSLACFDVQPLKNRFKYLFDDSGHKKLRRLKSSRWWLWL